MRTCPACDGYYTATNLYTMRFIIPDEWAMPKQYDVLRCRCGMVYADVSAGYLQHYSKFSKYADVSVGTSAGVKPWDRARFENIADRISNWTSWEGREAPKVLDFGCGAGGLMRVLSQNRNGKLWDVYGYDPSPDAVAQTGSTKATHNQSSLPMDFDCVVLSHVLEHCENPKATLALAMSHLRPGGSVYIEVPDASRYDPKQAPFQDFNTEHINHFTLRTLAKMLEVCGVEIENDGQTIIAANEDVEYPACWVMARRGWAADYIDYSREGMEKLLWQLAAITQDGDETFTIWGTGQFLFKLLGSLEPGTAKTISARAFAAFVDRNKSYHGLHLLGKPIKPPEETDFGDRPIVVASILNQKQILADIAKLGLRNKVLTLNMESDADA